MPERDSDYYRGNNQHLIPKGARQKIDRTIIQYGRLASIVYGEMVIMKTSPELKSLFILSRLGNDVHPHLLQFSGQINSVRVSYSSLTIFNN